MRSEDLAEPHTTVSAQRKATGGAGQRANAGHQALTMTETAAGGGMDPKGTNSG